MKRIKAWWKRLRGLDEIEKLRADIERLNVAVLQQGTELRLANAEIEDSKKRLELERSEHDKSKRHVQKMWAFIAIRHRLHDPPLDGTIRSLLQHSEGRQ